MHEHPVTLCADLSRTRDSHSSSKEHTMGLLSFVKDAGQKLFNLGSKDAGAATPAAASAPPSQADVAALNDTAGKAILNYIKTQNLPVDNLQVTFDGATATATVSGQ